ncbi:MAG TPA: MMPL family transporter [Solirubrobacteraceae bacterium]|nr:MMPL family transporter [Solirubrobacteraceae bacterium]
MPSPLVEFTLRRRRWIALGWLLLAIAGGWAASTLSSHLSQRFDAPDRPAFQANAQIVRHFGTGGVIAPIVLVGHRGQTGALRRVAAAVPHARAVIGGGGLTSADGTVVTALVFPAPGPRAPDTNAAALAAARGAAATAHVQVTGSRALATGSRSKGAGLLVETLLGGLGALVVLVLVFGSPLALVPIIVAAISILTTFLVLRGLAAGFTISFVVQFLAGLIGLGVAIDYSLLLIVRWREERDAGAAPDDAVRRAMVTAGHSIFVSGITVGIGLIALVAVPVAFIRSIGVGGMLIPLISVAVTLTLLPGLLSSLGPRLDRRRDARRAAREPRTPAWERWSALVVRHRWVAAGAGLAVMIVLAVVATGLNPGEPSSFSLAASGPARAALDTIARTDLGDGTLTPIEVLAPQRSAAQTRRRLASIHGVRTVLDPPGPAWSRDGQQLLEVLPSADSATPLGGATLDAVRARHSATVLVGGVNAQNSDLTDAIYGSFPLMIALIAVLTFGLLAVALRSIVLPLKAIALNVLSIGSAFGVVVLIWQDGHGSQLLGSLPGTGAITNWVPLAIFAFLYGLSMDYEVFILSRIREEYDRSDSTPRAVIAGLSHTGRLVTSAALILFLAFVALGATPETQIKILATGLAVGIALDATVVRALIVPALITLLGRANWWAPGRLGRRP